MKKFKERMDVLLGDARRSRETRRMASVIKLQAWWRGVLACRAGKKIMKARRQALRQEWRAHRREDRLVRRTWPYQLASFFGLTPALHTDTREEQAIRHVPWWTRHRAREYIWTNKSDWAHFYTSKPDQADFFQSYRERYNIPHRHKGEAKRGFDVGTIEELADQVRLMTDYIRNNAQYYAILAHYYLGVYTRYKL